jgi:hypothetical protein
VVETVLCRRLWVLVFIEHGTRRLHLAGVRAQPTGAWAVQQARNLAMDLGDHFGTLRLPIHDRDPLFTAPGPDPDPRPTPPDLGTPRVFDPLQRPQAAPIAATTSPDHETQPNRDAAELHDLRSIHRRPVVAGGVSQDHHAA